MATLYRLTMSYNLANGAETASNSMWLLDIPGTSTLATAAARVDAYSGVKWNAEKLYMAPSTLPRRYRLDRVNIVSGLTEAGIDCLTPGGASANTDTNPPLQCTPVLTLRTDTSGRSGRGRMYLPPIAQQQVTGNKGLISGTARDAVCLAYANFITGLKSAGVPLTAVVYSRKLGGALPVTSVEMDDVLDTMRSRRRSLVGQRKVIAV